MSWLPSELLGPEVTPLSSAPHLASSGPMRNSNFLSYLGRKRSKHFRTGVALELGHLEECTLGSPGSDKISLQEAKRGMCTLPEALLSFSLDLLSSSYQEIILECAPSQFSSKLCQSLKPYRARRSFVPTSQPGLLLC